MQKEIIYKGFSENPSDYECPDGELASSLGMVPEDNAMQPMLPPKELNLSLREKQIVVKWASDNTTRAFNRYPDGDIGREDNPSYPYCWLDNEDTRLYTALESPNIGDKAHLSYTYVTPPVEYQTYYNITDVIKKEELFYIHKGNKYTHYIKKDGGKIRNGVILLHDFGSTKIYEANAVGNTLIILTENGMHYFLWVDGAYKYLGSHLPELPIQFGLSAGRYSSPEFEVNYEKEVLVNVPDLQVWDEETQAWVWAYGDTDTYLRDNTVESINSHNYSDDLKNTITQGVMAQVNKHIETYRKAGHFLFPFFVRYAFRLYDGSLTMHSAPVLMTIASKQNPYVAFTGLHRNEDEPVRSGSPLPSEGSYTHHHIHSQRGKFVLYLTYSSLCYKVLNSSYQNALNDWRDIISSVDIFISEPLWTYDQSGSCTGLNWDGNRFADGHSICSSPISSWFLAVSDYNMYDGLDLRTRPIVKMPLKAITRDQITGNSRFYLLTSIKPEQLNSGGPAPISIPEGYLQSLSSRELMTDDYDSHDKLIPSKAYPYNARLDITGIEKRFNLYHAASMLPYSNGAGGDMVQVQIWVFIKTDQGERVIASLDNGGLSLETWFNQNMPYHYLYVPYSGAYKAVILRRHGDDNYREVDLLPHPYLNGAYFFSEWNTSPWTMGRNGSRPTVKTGPISLPNKIYTSEVNNPFFFPVSGIVTIGTANILDICSAARPLSEGQFGQFPLYAFTDEGVWALELSNDGTYKARQPITRDVCISTDSITQIDSAVLFATDRGIMLIQGSTATCISDELTTNNAFDSSKLPNLDKVLQDYAEEQDITYVPFLEYVKSCRMIYDYVHQRIIVFNPETETVNGQQVRKYSYAYVYSLKSKKWGMMYSTIAGTVSSYPNALAVTDDGTTQTVVDYSGEEEAGEGQSLTGLKGVIITRPIKLDNPDVLKTVNTVITRGKFEKGHVQTILYGSRDLEHWHMIASSVDHTLRYLHGTPYKYYRIVLLCDLDKGESIISSTVEYTPKYTDQIR